MKISGLPLRNYYVADSILLRSWFALLSLDLSSLENFYAQIPAEISPETKERAQYKRHSRPVAWNRRQL